jgi:hypothetical protein
MKQTAKPRKQIYALGGNGCTLGTRTLFSDDRIYSTELADTVSPYHTESHH